MTNFEKIKAMSVEEMADFVRQTENKEIWKKLCKNACLKDESLAVCQQCRIEWLQAEAD